MWNRDAGLIAGLALRNRELFFAAMFSARSQTLLALGEDEKRLGAQLGLTAVLHTWTRDLRFLTRDGARWKATRQDYLFPVRVLSALFRGKLVPALDTAFREGQLNVTGVDGFGTGTGMSLPRRRPRWRWGTNSTCVGAWGLMSTNAMHSSSSWTFFTAGICPSMILQNRQSDSWRA